jgi:hypothetical protein
MSGVFSAKVLLHRELLVNDPDYELCADRQLYRQITEVLREYWLDKPVAYMLKSNTEDKRSMDAVEKTITARARGITYKQIYIPIYSSSQMPSDVFQCIWCGGYTKNDMRGHCCACGAPRNKESFENAGRDGYETHQSP